MPEATAIVPVARAVANLARAVNVTPDEIIEPLKRQIMPNASDAELAAFCMIAAKYGLDPFLRQVYAIRNEKTGAYQPYISVDGWYALAERHPQMDGAEFAEIREDGRLVAITCSIWRKDRTRPTVVTEYLKECRRDTPPWRQHETRLLRHRAFIQCCRIAFGVTDYSDPELETGTASSQVNAVRRLEAALATTEPAAQADAPAPTAKRDDAAFAAEVLDPVVVDAVVVEQDTDESLAKRLVDANAAVGVVTDMDAVLSRAKKAAKKEGKTVGDWLAERVRKAEAALAASSPNPEGTTNADAAQS